MVAAVALVLATGAALWWLRLDAAGLPGTDATRALPATVLLESGARALAAPFAIAVVVMCGGLLLRRRQGRGPSTSAIAITCGAVLLVGALVAIAWTATSPKLRPLALALADGGSELTGLSVAEANGGRYVVVLPTDDARSPLDGAEEPHLVEVDSAAIQRSVELDPIAVDGNAAPKRVGDALELLRDEAGPVPRTVVTDDPAATFAPLVILDSAERLPPVGARDFIRHSVLAWWKDMLCDDELFAIGSEHQDAGRRRLPPLDVVRLGARERPYRNVPAADLSCEDERRAPVPATAHTRPWDEDRAPGLGIKEGFYLDLDDDYYHPPLSLSEGSPPYVDAVPAVFEAARETVGGDPGLRITYWFLYTRSRPPVTGTVRVEFIREGDWERVSVLLRRGASSREYAPVSVRFHYYDHHRDVPWDQVIRTSGEGDAATHPVVYTAFGTHVPYWAPGIYRVRLGYAARTYDYRRRPWIGDRALACGSCPRWRTWERLTNARREPWYGYGGAWGTPYVASRNSGPLGPSPYARADEGSPVEWSIGTNPPPRQLPPSIELLTD